MNLKVPSVGLLITNSVVLVILADLFKHKMNCQHSSDLKLDPPPKAVVRYSERCH